MWRRLTLSAANPSDETLHTFVKGQCASARERKSSTLTKIQYYKKGSGFVCGLGGETMPINRLLKDKRTPEEIERLNEAFNHALNLMGVLDRNDPLCDLVARKVIEVGATGISETREIAEIAVVRIGLR